MFLGMSPRCNVIVPQSREEALQAVLLDLLFGLLPPGSALVVVVAIVVRSHFGSSRDALGREGPQRHGGAERCSGDGSRAGRARERAAEGALASLAALARPRAARHGARHRRCAHPAEEQ